MTPPLVHLLPLAGLQQVGDEVAKAPALEVRTLLQVLDEMPRQCGGHPLRSALKKAEAIDGSVHAAESLTPAT